MVQTKRRHKSAPQRRKKKQTRNIPSWVYLVVAIAILLLIYWWTNRKPSSTDEPSTKAPTEQVIAEKDNTPQRTTKPTTTRKQKPTEEVITSALEIPRLEAQLQEQIIRHDGYTVSFNSSLRLPNWVAWTLTLAEVQGDVPRGSHFRPDPMVKGVQAKDKDYRKSGWDRGHMAPAADMRWSEKAMKESFYFTNICPQHPNLNRGDWKVLEEETRSWAMKFGEVYIATGPIVSATQPRRMGATQVTIPDSFYKVMLVKHRGEYHAIGFLFPNKAGHNKLSHYARSVDDVERITKMDFFSSLPDSIENAVEQDFKLLTWGLY